MIGRLTGRIVEEGDQGQLLVDVQGVGYEVIAPYGTRSRAAVGQDGLVTLSIHTLAREDALLLYGFAQSQERDAFRVVIGISNVGPKLALALLSALEVADLAEIVARGETARLVSIPGIGRKTAERLVLELKGKLEGKTFPTQSQAPDRSGLRPRDSTTQLHSALIGLGFRPSDAERAVSALSARIESGAEISVLLREALASLTAGASKGAKPG